VAELISESPAEPMSEWAAELIPETPADLISESAADLCRIPQAELQELPSGQCNIRAPKPQKLLDHPPFVSAIVLDASNPDDGHRPPLGQ
jgi:uncharacterized lipoprotein